MLPYGVEVYGGSISKSTWKEFENVQKLFLIKFLQVRTQTPYILLLLESRLYPIKVMGMEWFVAYMLKIHKNPPRQLSKVAWRVSKRALKLHKSKTLIFGWMEDSKNGLEYGMHYTCYIMT